MCPCLKFFLIEMGIEEFSITIPCKKTFFIGHSFLLTALRTSWFGLRNASMIFLILSTHRCLISAEVSRVLESLYGSFVSKTDVSSQTNLHGFTSSGALIDPGTQVPRPIYPARHLF